MFEIHFSISNNDFYKKMKCKGFHLLQDVSNHLGFKGPCPMEHEDWLTYLEVHFDLRYKTLSYKTLVLFKIVRCHVINCTNQLMDVIIRVMNHDTPRDMSKI